MAMKRIALILALTLPAPALAQDEGPSLMERGIRMFFEGLAQEMEPAMQELRSLVDEAGPAMESFLREMGPALKDVFEEVKDFSVYEPPEVLPNGDIIMRRKEPLDPTEPETSEELAPGEEIEL
ncbi:hypothetical protein [Pseudooceanicola sp. MF1-13]|uniref:hypothetical protein n=1 Tax=Pseudooceanicola sp. MF1-13 TaxID=3379095 RepID=UPI0038911FC7